MLTASSMRAVMRRGVDTATSTPHDSSNSHSVLGVVDARHGAQHSELGLGEQRQHGVGLVVARRSDADVGRLRPGLLEGGQLAHVGEQLRTPRGPSRACTSSASPSR